MKLSEKFQVASLILIRGIPGSGKSTLAKALIKAGMAQVHLEADMWFTDAEGVYHWKPSEVPLAHEWCLHETELHLTHDFDVVVSNTFTKDVYYQRYIELASKFGASVQTYICMGEFKNIHGVPDAMMDKFKQQAKWLRG